MNQFILLGVAYAVLFALLVSTNFFTNFSIKIKIFLIFLVLIFSIISYSSIREMQGIPYRDKDLNSSKEDIIKKRLYEQSFSNLLSTKKWRDKWRMTKSG